MRRREIPGYLGGNRQTMGAKQERVERVLGRLPGRDLGWPWQCRCGGTLATKYRGRFYCWSCGRRKVNADVVTCPGYGTFRDAWATKPDIAPEERDARTFPHRKR